MEKYLINFYQGVVLLPKFDNSSPYNFVKVTWLWGNDVTNFWDRVPNGTLWMRFTSCPSLIFLASPWLEIYRFSNWLYCWLWADHSYLISLSMMLGHKKQSKPSPFDKNIQEQHRIWHKSFQMIQLAGIKNWVAYLINRLQRFNLSFLKHTW